VTSPQEAAQEAISWLACVVDWAFLCSRFGAWSSSLSVHACPVLLQHALIRRPLGLVCANKQVGLPSLHGSLCRCIMVTLTGMVMQYITGWQYHTGSRAELGWLTACARFCCLCLSKCGLIGKQTTQA